LKDETPCSRQQANIQTKTLHNNRHDAHHLGWCGWFALRGSQRGYKDKGFYAR
jgi:hypothetical protein